MSPFYLLKPIVDKIVVRGMATSDAKAFNAISRSLSFQDILENIGLEAIISVMREIDYKASDQPLL